MLRRGVRISLLLVVALTLSATATVARAQVDKSATIKLLFDKAEDARKAGDFRKAAAIWHQIYLQDPSQPMSLYNAALMEEKAGDLEAAARHLREFLSVTDASHPRHALAKVRLQAVVAKHQAAQNARVAEQLLAEKRTREAAAKTQGAGAGPSAAAVATQDSTASTTPGWIAVIGGGAALATAGVLYGLGVAEDSDVRQRYADGELTQTEAQSAIEDLQRNDLIYAGVAGVGAIGVGVGVYLLTRSRRTGGEGEKPSDSTFRVAPWIGASGLTAVYMF